MLMVDTYIHVFTCVAEAEGKTGSYVTGIDICWVWWWYAFRIAYCCGYVGGEGRVYVLYV